MIRHAARVLDAHRAACRADAKRRSNNCIALMFALLVPATIALWVLVLGNSTGTALPVLIVSLVAVVPVLLRILRLDRRIAQ